MWTTETLDEYTEAMSENEREAEPVPGLLMIIDAGEVGMELLRSLFE